MKRILWIVFFFATALTIVLIHQFRALDLVSLRSLIESTGWLAPVVYILVYCMATLLFMPSTPLNLMGGILFGAMWGTLWTSLAALLVAWLCFALTREWAQAWVHQRLNEQWSEQWRSFDRELQKGGISYLFALRLLPILPYGLVNFGAGLTTLSYRDYLIGTALGTLPGIFPFVLLGSLGREAISTGEILPLLLPLALIGLLVGGSTWYQQHQRHS